MLRLVALPAAEYVLPLLMARPLRNAAEAVAGVFGRLGLRAGEWRSAPAAATAESSHLPVRCGFSFFPS